MAAKSGRMQFFIAFLMGIVILAMPFSYALFRFSGSRPEIPSASEGYYPQSSDSILLAIALKNDEKDLPNCFVLCRISPLEGSVTMAVLPPETLVEDAGSFYSADVVWVREGGKRGSAAIQATVGVICERWLEIDSQALVRLGDVTGAIDFTLDEPVSLENGLMTLPAQRQLIDGTRASLLINYRGYSGGEAQRLDMVARLAEQMIYQRMPMMSESLLVKLFETAVNNGLSDMTVGDFESRRRALTHMVSRGIEVNIIPVSGEHNENNNTFLLSSQTIEDIRQAMADKKAV